MVSLFDCLALCSFLLTLSILEHFKNPSISKNPLHHTRHATPWRDIDALAGWLFLILQGNSMSTAISY